ncbi:MAG: hypothetical protein PHQ59_03325 [Candidatus Daviesbacteria bacterium]|nr:hypothetical protein [Candidatus Daviesbacteria bacterium]
MSLESGVIRGNTEQVSENSKKWRRIVDDPLNQILRIAATGERWGAEILENIEKRYRRTALAPLVVATLTVASITAADVLPRILSADSIFPPPAAGDSTRVRIINYYRSPIVATTNITNVVGVSGYYTNTVSGCSYGYMRAKYATGLPEHLNDGAATIFAELPDGFQASIETEFGGYDPAVAPTLTLEEQARRVDRMFNQGIVNGSTLQFIAGRYRENICTSNYSKEADDYDMPNGSNDAGDVQRAAALYRQTYPIAGITNNLSQIAVNLLGLSPMVNISFDPESNPVRAGGIVTKTIIGKDVRATEGVGGEEIHLVFDPQKIELKEIKPNADFSKTGRVVAPALGPGQVLDAVEKANKDGSITFPFISWGKYPNGPEGDIKLIDVVMQVKPGISSGEIRLEADVSLNKVSGDAIGKGRSIGTINIASEATPIPTVIPTATPVIENLNYKSYLTGIQRNAP